MFKNKRIKGILSTFVGTILAVGVLAGGAAPATADDGPPPDTLSPSFTLEANYVPASAGVEAHTDIVLVVTDETELVSVDLSATGGKTSVIPPAALGYNEVDGTEFGAVLNAKSATWFTFVAVDAAGNETEFSVLLYKKIKQFFRGGGNEY